MTQKSILDVASAAAAKQHRSNSQLLKEMEQKAAKLARAKELVHRAAVQEALATRRRRIVRMHTALQGVASLCELGLSRQFQALIKARGRPVTFWGGERSITPGYDMADIHWKWVSRIELTCTELVIDNHNETSNNYGTTYRMDGANIMERIPFAECEQYVRTRPFWSVATPDVVDPNCSKDDDINQVYSTERLFEILVECATSRKFAKLVRAAIKR